MDKKDSQISFSFKGIKVEQFALLEESYGPKKEEVKLGTELQFKVEQSNKQIGVFASFEFSQAKNAFLKIVISCHFKIQEKSWNSLSNLEEQKIIIPKGFLIHLAMLTVGTSRGVLFAKTEGTVFSKFIIPTVDVTKMILEDVVINVVAV
ncbi:hypothetical protein ACFP2F_09140 [Hymenobacter artigasi]|uniref:Uncharacterized protein n=1 Tax=Hymenobacter artigasi TaxID=2719616 RepID=A0ABX1HL73_9BACT|nr:hypothetical protein [Hymenobacter artigasi]NKI89691.1 hypothetical protein [Hymenobacter artigasi]